LTFEVDGRVQLINVSILHVTLLCLPNIEGAALYLALDACWSTVLKAAWSFTIINLLRKTCGSSDANLCFKVHFRTKDV